MAEQNEKDFGLEEGMKVELLSDGDIFLLSGIIDKIEEDAIRIVNASGDDMPTIIHNSRVRIKGFRRDNSIIILHGSICGNSNAFWKIDQLSQFSFINKRDDYRHPLTIETTVNRLVAVLDDNGNERSISVQKTGNYEDRLSVAINCLLHDDDDYQNFYSCMLDDRCGYLQITSECYDAFGDNISAIKKGCYPELTEYYADLIENLEDKGMNYLIVDIRNNGGGYDSVAGALASLFTDKKSHMVSFGYEDAQGYHIAERQYIFPDGRYADIPVVVLVNSNCMSAGDGMAKFLGDCPNVTLMGVTASSGVNQNNGGYIYLTDNICVTYPVFLSLSEDGEPFIDTDHTRENKIPLDVVIPITSENAKTIFSIDNYDSEAMEKGKIVFKRDVELEYAVRYLLNRQ